MHRIAIFTAGSVGVTRTMKHTTLRFALMISGFAALAGAHLLFAQPARAATVPVTNTLDSGAGSLRQTILDAADGDTVVFDSAVFNVPLTITLTSGQIEISKSLTIDGAAGGVVTPTISGNNTSRVLNFMAYASATVSNLRIVNGYCGNYDNSCTGAGIYASGILTVNDTIFENNTSQYMGGGLGSNYGTLYVNRCQFTGNRGYWGGGGIYLRSDRNWSSSINDSSFYNNHSSGEGGSIMNTGYTSISNSLFLSNMSDSDGGALSNRGVLTIKASWFISNTSPHAGGGGVYNVEWLIVNNSIFRGNVAYRSGGAIHNGSHLSVTDGEFDDNQAPMGGGILNGYLMDISNVTLHDNHAITGSAIWAGYYTTNMTNTTLYSNTSTQFGGIASNGFMNAVNVTMIDNNFGDVGILGTSTARFINSIISTCNNTSSNAIVDGGHNIDAGNTCGFTATTSLTNTNPLLGSLGFYGGHVPTLPLLPGSPAIDGGDDSACPDTDARGVHRPYGAHCDIGAFEATFIVRQLRLILVQR